VHFELTPVIASLNEYLSHPSYAGLDMLVNSSALHSYYSQEMNEHMNSFLTQFNTIHANDPQAALQLSVDFMQQLRTDILNAPVVVGASGAVFGLLVAYGILFSETYLYVYMVIPIKAKYFVIIYGLLELFSGIAHQAGDNVAHFAHLGGLLTGLLLILYWRWTNRRNTNNFG